MLKILRRAAVRRYVEEIDRILFYPMRGNIEGRYVPYIFSGGFDLFEKKIEGKYRNNYITI